MKKLILLLITIISSTCLLEGQSIRWLESFNNDNVVALATEDNLWVGLSYGGGLVKLDIITYKKNVL